jgi:uncharacterized protein (TIGR02452 family)
MNVRTSLISRDAAAQLGQETIRILKTGWYVAPSGRSVEIRTAVAQSRSATVAYSPSEDLIGQPQQRYKTTVEIVNETTLAAGSRLVSEGRRLGVLNFASATSPGGGLLQGAQAQEESLARSSGLFACLERQPMYEFHRTMEGYRGGLYTKYALYSPEVPMFRHENGQLLEEPWSCDILTCAAVNASHASALHDGEVISSEMRDRVLRVLQVFAVRDCETLVLGAWGCGAFRNDANMVAAHFRDALFGPFKRVFGRVVFAIADWSRERAFIGPFEYAFRINESKW